MTEAADRRRWLIWMGARFLLIYAVATAATSWLPVFEWAERANVALLDAGYAAIGPNARHLSIEPGETGPTYRLETGAASGSEVLRQPHHPHAYVGMLFVVAVFATPGVSRRTRGRGMVVGLVAVTCFEVGLLFADVEAWAARAAGAPAPSWWSLAGLFGVLHRSAASGLIAIFAWLLFVRDELAGEVGATRVEGDVGVAASDATT